LDRAKELGLEWPLAPELSDPELSKMFYPSKVAGVSDRKMPDAEYVRKELLKNGVSKKLLWLVAINSVYCNVLPMVRKLDLALLTKVSHQSTVMRSLLLANIALPHPSRDYYRKILLN
jgi:hypothetical protein